jgi:calcineurin-like phosphoesterase family protein
MEKINKIKYWFTADEHFGHTNIIKYCNRPFSSVEEMDYAIIKKHNEVVGMDDTVIHLGDFTLKSKEKALSYISRLNGNHIFIQGSHDKWMDPDHHEIWEGNIEGVHIVGCHYAMRVWGESHYNSWQLFGHSHGRLEGIGKQIDVGVDTHNFYPYSFDEIKVIMKLKGDNFNKLKE